jgi:DDB1- and CUL4-associated factor 13
MANVSQKVKSIARSSDQYLARKGDPPRLQRNLDPALHPLAKAREYTRALNATKLERYFAKPFIAQLGNGHIDGVYQIAKNGRILSAVASGSGDGVVKAWDLVSREHVFSVRAHDGGVNGLCYTVDGRLLSCSSDKVIKLWDTKSQEVFLLFFFLGLQTDGSLCKYIPGLRGSILSTIIGMILFLQPLPLQ